MGLSQEGGFENREAIKQAAGDYLEGIEEGDVEGKKVLFVFLRNADKATPFIVRLGEGFESDVEDLRRIVNLARVAEERIKEIGGEHVKEIKLSEAIFENWYLSVELDDGRVRTVVLDQEKDVSKDLRTIEKELGHKVIPPRDLMPQVMAVIEKAREETMRTGKDVVVTNGKISLWLGVGIQRSNWIAMALRDYFGVRRGGALILKHDFLVGKSEAEQAGSIEKSA